MKIPEYLKDGDGIGFAAPSFGCAIEPYKSAFDNSLKKWSALGYKTVPGPNVYKGDGTGISTDPESCGRELTQMYLSDECDAIISCGGGELMCETLDYVDFKSIADARPKWYMGYSDNTNFTFLLTTLCDTAAIYGPCAPAFGMEPWHEALKDALSLLKGEKKVFSGYPLYEEESLKDEEHPLMPYNATKPREIKIFNPAGSVAGLGDEARFSGRMVGGCMDCLVNLTGTKYDKVAEFGEKYADDGIIWFLESCDLNVFAIRRAVWQMKNAGWFRHVKGFLIGRPLVHGQNMMGLDQYRAVTEPLAEYGVPIIMDLDIGHIPPMMPVISGGKADVVCSGQEIRIEY